MKGKRILLARYFSPFLSRRRVADEDGQVGRGQDMIGSPAGRSNELGFHSKCGKKSVENWIRGVMCADLHLLLYSYMLIFLH